MRSNFNKKKIKNQVYTVSRHQKADHILVQRIVEEDFHTKKWKSIITKQKQNKNKKTTTIK